MLRFIALDAVFFLLPFAAYALWLVVTRRSMSNPDDWQVKTIAWLALAGAVLMVVVLVIFIHLDPSPPGGVYVPPRIEDGVIIPGHIEPAGGGG